MTNQHEKVVIIGSGPAGHSAAIYTGRAMLKPLMFEGQMAAGVAAGGQLTTTTDVENYPGFDDGILGPDLMEKMRKHSLNSGARIETQTIEKIDLSSTPFKIWPEYVESPITADTVIICTGATAKRLGIKGEDQFWQRGMSACAVCDGALPVFRDKPLVVIGGGDSACEEATYLTKYGSKVYLLVRKDEMRASKVMQERTINNPKIDILWNTEAIEAMGDTMLEQVRVFNNKTKEETMITANGLFYAIGHTPNTAFLNGQLECDDTGYIITTPGTTKTNIPGVFAAGDVQDHEYRQAITSAGTGCMAALEAEKYLQTLK